jgi:hypothetical protein
MRVANTAAPVFRRRRSLLESKERAKHGNKCISLLLSRLIVLFHLRFCFEMWFCLCEYLITDFMPRNLFVFHFTFLAGEDFVLIKCV